MKKVGIIIGSTRDTRKGYKIGEWVFNEVSDTLNQFNIIDLKEVDLVHYNEPSSPMSSSGYKHTSTKNWSKIVSEYDSFIFVTPEYNGFFTGALKDAIDYLYHEWKNKSYIIVGYGGRGAKNAAGHLESLLNRFEMVNIGNIAISQPWTSLQEDGSILKDYIDGDIKELVNKLIKK